MNGIHDMGGHQCFGLLHINAHEPVFASDWEARVFALMLTLEEQGHWNLDEARFACESVTPARYLRAGYYGVWFEALQQLLQDHPLQASPTAPARAAPAQAAEDDVGMARPAAAAPLFSVGDNVIIRNLQPSGHTRLPAYIRGHAGTVHRVHGCHVFPDSHAAGAGEDPHWLYNVCFPAQTLWEDSDAAVCSGAVHVDCWEPYLEPAAR